MGGGCSAWSLAVAAADLILTTRRRGREPGLREAALCTAGVVALGALFGAALAAVAGPRASGQFYAGWLTEYSLSLDNLFVFVLLIGRSAVPAGCAAESCCSASASPCCCGRCSSWRARPR